MVSPDWNQRAAQPQHVKESPDQLANEIRLARPLDRLAAAIVDVFVVLAPVYVLVSAPFKRWLTTSYMLGSEPDFVMTLSMMLLVGMSLVMIYQTVALYFFSTTLGKRLFDLKVVSVFNHKVRLWDFFIRSVLWMMELLLLGLPWLAVFSNPRRRPLHDKVCDTVVVSRSDTGVSEPMAWERGLVGMVFAAAAGLFAVSMFIQVREVFQKLKMEESFAALVSKEPEQCEAVTRNLESEDAANESEAHSRLQTAMLLYASGVVDRSCLEAEVHYESSKRQSIAPLTYLAQAFVYADEAEVSNAYLDQVCSMEPQSAECAMSRLVGAWSESDWQLVEDILRSSPEGSGYLEIWGVRHYMKQAKYVEALSKLDSLLTRKPVKEFSLVQRVKALQSLYREPEALSAYQQAMSVLPSEESRDLSAWLCSHQLQNSCKALSGIACKHMYKPEDKSLTAKLDFERPPEALAQVLSMECGSDVDYLKLSEITKDESWNQFFRANLKRQRQDRSAAADLFTEVIANEETPDILRVEATRRLVRFATTAQMEKAVEVWRDFDSREAWVQAGNILFARLVEQSNEALALRVGRYLSRAQALSPEASEIMNAMADIIEDGGRMPASANSKKRGEP